MKVDVALTQVDASDDEVWGVDRNHHIFKRPVDGSGSWKRIGGGLKHVSASGNGYVWGVNSGNKIFKCKKPCNGKWKQTDGGLIYISKSMQARLTFMGQMVLTCTEGLLMDLKDGGTFQLRNT